MSRPLHVLVTGAAGQIGYVLSFRIANGDLFGDRKIILHLLEIRPAMPMLESILMELDDCTFPNLERVIGTCDTEEAFRDVDFAFLMGSIPKKANMSMEAYIERNHAIFKEHGQALSKYSKPTVKVLVVGLPANTNCLIASKYATNIPRENFSAMTRLDHNRAVSALSQKLKVHPEHVQRVIVWGNRSRTQVYDISHATCDGENVKDRLNQEYIDHEFGESMHSRGLRGAGLRGPSTAASAAHSAICHMRDWVYGTRAGDFVSMAIPVPETKPYGIEPGIVFSLPCTVDRDGKIHIVEDLEVSPDLREQMRETEEELKSEMEIALKFE